MNHNDLMLTNKILIHPSLRQRLAHVGPYHAFEIKIQNYSMIVDAFGLEAARFAYATLLARVQCAIGSAGITSPEGEARLGVIVWGEQTYGPVRLGFGGGEWPEALIRDIVLEPVFTATGAVHINATLINFDSSERGLNNELGSASRDAVEPSAAEHVRRSYRSDMAVLSPVLAAIGGFRGAEQAGLTGSVVDVDIGWRPIGRAAAPSETAFYEASLSLVNADGQFVPCEHVIAASQRVGLAHLLEKYIVSSVVDELIEARGAVSLVVAVSGAGLADPHFWRDVLERLERGGGVACDLIVEVTGSAVASAVQGMCETLAMIRRQGCRISFGNLGAGATSLRDLVAFAPNFVTIDRYFLSPASRSKFGDLPLSHLVGFAHAMGAEVIIDGVDCIKLTKVARETGAALQKGAWCGGQRFFRSWAKKATLDPGHEIPDYSILEL